jgi:hypothetical protein
MDGRPAVNREGMRIARLAGAILVGIGVGGAALKYLVPFAVQAFVRVIGLVTDACVWFAMSLSVGMSVWSMLGVVGRTATSLLTTPAASATLAALVAIGALAAYGLQRLLGGDADVRR